MCNTYLIIDDGITLIDAGLRGNVKKVYANLEKLGCAPKDISTIIITHAHIDHMGGLHQIWEDSDAKVMVGDKDADVVSGKEPPRVPRGVLFAIARIFMGFLKYHPVPVDSRLKGGERINVLGDLEVIPLPGHTPGNIGLFSPKNRLLFSSDTVRIKNGKFLVPLNFKTNKAEALDSIRRISELDCEIILPGHGKPIMANASKRVGEFYQELARTNK
jgi:glyoxylase-like metal-dependent hydrolase (beta-lactamase superfamily II)